MRIRRFITVRTIVHLTALALATMGLPGCGTSDQELKAAIEAKLASDPTTSSLELSVSVTRGIAFIRGEVQTSEQQARAIEMASAVEGVSKVFHELDLDELATVVAAVKSALAAEPLLASVPIEVDSRDGIVRLISADTNREQRERAMAVARSVDGVEKVEDRMK